MAISVVARQRVVTGLWGGRKAGSFAGRAAAIVPVLRPDVFYGVSYRRKSRKEIEEVVAVEVRESIVAALGGGAKGKMPELSVSISREGLEELVTIRAKGITKINMDAIIVAILASEL